jgi:diguanylate cyclase (GGDEF)-like protein
MPKNNIETIEAINRKSRDSAIGNPKASLGFAESALMLSEELGYDKGRADALLNLGWASFYSSRLPDAYSAFDGAHRLYEKIDDPAGMCRTLNAFGDYNHSISRLDKAIEYHTRSRDLAKSHGILDHELIAMTSLGELCLELGNPNEALEYLIPAYDRMPAEFPKGNIADCLRIIGQAFLALDNPGLAAAFTRKSYDVATGSDGLIVATDSLETLAAIMVAEGDTEGALPLLAEGLEAAATTGNLGQRAGLLIVSATLLISIGKPDEALGTLSEAESLCLASNHKVKLYRVYEQMSKAFEASGNHKMSLDYYKRFSRYRYEVQRDETAWKLHRLQAQAGLEQALREADSFRLRNIDLKEKADILEDVNRQVISMSEIGRRITASLDFSTVIQTLYDCLKPYLEMDMFGIALPDGARENLVYKRFYEDGIVKGNREIRIDSDRSFTAWAFRNQRPVLLADNKAEYSKYLDKPALYIGKSTQSIVCIPLAIEDRSIGVLTIQNYKAHAYSPRHLGLLEALAPYIAIAVENALIHDRLEELNKALSVEKRRLERATLKISHLANHDSLTGLPNRRLLFELAGKALESARRAGSILGVLFIDIDDFKPINDNFGHAAGDSALVEIAERLRNHVRASDIIARIGGDEFVAVLTNVKAIADIERVAEKLIAMCSKSISLGWGSSTIGVSMGISVYPADGAAMEELLNKADSAMYGIKHAGKQAFAFWKDSIDGMPPD